MFKSLISRNNEVIFYGSLWIMWSLSWILIITLASSMNPDYDLGNLATTGFADNPKYLWISVIFIVVLSISIIALIMFIIKTILLQKYTKVYNLNDGALIFVYFITTMLFYFGIIFFILYKDRLSNVRTRSNVYEAKKLDNYIGDRANNVQLSDNRVISISTNKRPPQQQKQPQQQGNNVKQPQRGRL